MEHVVDSAIVIESQRIVVSWIVPVAILLGSAVVGIAFERFILYRLRKFAEKTVWQGDEILIDALRGMTTILFIIIGAFAASFFVNIPGHYLTLGHKILKVLVILVSTVILSRIAVGFVGLSSGKEDARLPSASILTYITRALVFLIGLLIVLQSLGISITPLLTALGVGGLAVALALQDTLSNLFAGIHIVASKKIRPGDYIKLEGGQEGFVIDISWRTTTLRHLANYMFIVPNVKISTGIVADYDQPQRDTGVAVEFGVSYDSDLAKVERVATEAASAVVKDVTGTVPEVEPSVRFINFAQTAITGAVSVRAKQYTDQFLIKHELIKRLHEQFKKEGIVMPYPIPQPPYKQ